jgi:hypothetical protein
LGTSKVVLVHAIGAFRDVIAARIYHKEPIPTPSKICAIERLFDSKQAISLSSMNLLLLPGAKHLILK